MGMAGRERWRSRAGWCYLLFTMLALADITVVGFRAFGGNGTLQSISIAVVPVGFLALPIGLGVLSGQRLWRVSGVGFSAVLAVGCVAGLLTTWRLGNTHWMDFLGVAPRWLPTGGRSPLMLAAGLMSLTQVGVLLGGPSCVVTPPRRALSRAAGAAGLPCVPLAVWLFGVPFAMLALMMHSEEVSYSGRIVDDTGAPVPHATVHLRRCDWAGGMYDLQTAPPTGPEGHYAFTGVGPVNVRMVGTGEFGWHRIDAAAPGYASAYLRVSPQSESLQRKTAWALFLGRHWPVPGTGDLTEPRLPAETSGAAITKLDLVLPREAVLRGRVTDEQGRAVPGYAARLVAMDAPEGQPPVFEQAFDGVGLRAREDGGFAVDGIPPGVYRFARYIDELRRREWAINPPLALSAGQRVDDYTLVVPNVPVDPETFGTLVGRVLRNGQPSKHGYVTFPEVEESNPSGKTGDDGRYRVEFVPPGEQIAVFRLWLYEDRRGGAQLFERRRVDIVAGGTTTLDLVVEGHGRIHGNFAGLPGTRWRVRVEDDRMPGEHSLGATAWKFEDRGAYELPGLPDGRYRVHGQCLRGEKIVAETWHEVVLDAGGAVRVDLDLHGEAAP